jgi:hypothetical protein
MVQLLKSSSTSHDHQELQSDAAAAQDPVAAIVAVTEESAASVMHIDQVAVASVAAAESDHVMHHIHVPPATAAAASALAVVASPKQLGASMSPLSEILVRARGLQSKNLAVTAAATSSRDGETGVSCTALVAALLTWKDLSSLSSEELNPSCKTSQVRPSFTFVIFRQFQAVQKPSTSRNLHACAKSLCMNLCRSSCSSSCTAA